MSSKSDRTSGIRIRGGHDVNEPIRLERVYAFENHGDPTDWTISWPTLGALNGAPIPSVERAVRVVRKNEKRILEVMDEKARLGHHFQHGPKPVPIDVGDLELPMKSAERRGLTSKIKPDLTDEERKQIRRDFETWRMPDDLEACVETFANKLGSTDFLGDKNSANSRDAWIAAKYAKAKGATAVRLVAGEWPDFEIKINGKIEQYEATQADVPDRKMIDEYKKADANRDDDGLSIEWDPYVDWIKRTDAIPEALKLASRKKAEKRYPSRKAGLVIYLLIDEYGVGLLIDENGKRQKKVEDCFRDSTAKAKDAFSTVDILWKNKVYPAWP